MIANQVRRAATRAAGGGDLLDTFTDTPGVLLANHTAESGHTYSDIRGVFSIDATGNSTYPTTHVAPFSAAQVNGLSQFGKKIKSTCNIPGSVQAGVATRILDSNNFLATVYSSNDVRVHAITAGSSAQIKASFNTMPAGTPKIMEVVDDGDSIQIYSLGILIVDFGSIANFAGVDGFGPVNNNSVASSNMTELSTTDV